MIFRNLLLLLLSVTLSTTQTSALSRSSAAGIALVTGATVGFLTRKITPSTPYSAYHKYDDGLPSSSFNLFIDGEISNATATGIVVGAATAKIIYWMLYHAKKLPHKI